MGPLALNGYSYALFIAKSKAACGLCFDQLGGHVELPWLMRKYDVIHKPEVHNVSQRRQRTEPRPRVTRTKIGEDRTCSSGDMLADRQTHTHTVITTFRSHIGVTWTKQRASLATCPVPTITSLLAITSDRKHIKLSNYSTPLNFAAGCVKRFEYSCNK